MSENQRSAGEIILKENSPKKMRTVCGCPMCPSKGVSIHIVCAFVAVGRRSRRASSAASERLCSLLFIAVYGVDVSTAKDALWPFLGNPDWWGG